MNPQQSATAAVFDGRDAAESKGLVDYSNKKTVFTFKDGLDT